MDQAQMLRIRDRLQAVEDELIAADMDELIVACDAGTWTWRTVAHARTEHGEDHWPAEAEAADGTERGIPPDYLYRGQGCARAVRARR
jgi:hypothetical protein